MKKIVPFGFKKGSGNGRRYTWHKDDPKDIFRFECNACIYGKILGPRGLLKLGAMCCHGDVINYGNLPYTDFSAPKHCAGAESSATSALYVMRPTPETAGSAAKVFNDYEGR